MCRIVVALNLSSLSKGLLGKYQIFQSLESLLYRYSFLKLSVIASEENLVILICGTYVHRVELLATCPCYAKAYIRHVVIVKADGIKDVCRNLWLLIQDSDIDFRNPRHQKLFE